MESVNLQKARDYKGLPAVARLVAQQVTTGGYLKPGHWLRDLHDFDLRTLSMIIDECQDTIDDPATSTMIGLTMILVQAEGLPLDPDVLNSQVNQLGLFITTESLARKGVVEVYYDNISFGDDAGELPIAKALT
jgi:hypothetical protein